MENSLHSTGVTGGELVNKRNYIKKLTWLMAGGMFVDGFVLGYIGAVLPSITKDLGLSAAWQGLIGAAALLGCLFGAPMGGWFSDRLGRRSMFTFDLMLFVVCSIAQFFVSDAYTLFIIRFFMGVAIGIEYAVGWPLLAEFAPARIRGKLLCLTEIAWYVGFLASYSLGYALTIQSVQWNIILGLSTVPTLIVLVMRLGTPESPRWLMSKGRKEEAMKIAAKYMGKEEQQDVLNQKYDSTTANASFADLFKSKNIKATIFYTTAFIGSAAPYFAIAFFVSTVLEKLGLKDGFAGGLFLNALAVVGTIVTTLLIERISRRKMAIYPFLVCTVALVTIGLVGNASPLVITICFLIFSLFNAISGTVLAVFPGEIFSSEVSGLGTGFATSMSRVAACVGTFLVPTIIKTHGVDIIIWASALICFAATIVAYLFCPETKGKKLSEIFG
ncbi:MFS transporter [Cupriavidus sp. TA19]|uniref:MFS transporter n=1 Tax=Cupriavidus sp. TA19 TaxID=701108 RepID=UPI0027294944|nr:MFS transporter [Cupriavidus sp. TA19]GLC95384.1 MFS transporter [Cupriavidus sp. TA19]